MATLLYRRLFKETAKQREPCIHEREIELRSEASEDRPDTAALFLKSEKHDVQPINSNTSTTGPCLICIEQVKAARKYRWKLMLGLFLPFSVQALDVTIIASALPFIASDFSKFPRYGIIPSRYL